MFLRLRQQTGETVWEMELPKRQSGVPMTYTVDGKQYIAMAMSARGEPAELVALTPAVGVCAVMTARAPAGLVGRPAEPQATMGAGCQPVAKPRCIRAAMHPA